MSTSWALFAVRKHHKHPDDYPTLVSITCRVKIFNRYNTERGKMPFWKVHLQRDASLTEYVTQFDSESLIFYDGGYNE